jgi:hypothetical protein
MKNIQSTTFAICSILLLATSSDVYGKVQSGSQAGEQLQPRARPAMIYVAEFSISASDVREESGILAQRRIVREGLLRRRGPLSQETDPSVTAANLVNGLAQAITDELNNQSITATRLPPNQSLPDNGWLVRGQFLEVDEGNRLQRAVIGFGAGASDMQIEVKVYDLSSHPNTPFLIFGDETGSGKKPGAILMMNPYVAAAKFVLSKNASQKDVKHAGAEIASNILKYMKERGLISANQQ